MTLSPRHWPDYEVLFWVIAGGQYLTIASRYNSYDNVMYAIEQHLGSLPKPLIFLSDVADSAMVEDYIQRGLVDIEV